MKINEVARLLEREGWTLKRDRLTSPLRSSLQAGVVAVAGKPVRDDAGCPSVTHSGGVVTMQQPGGQVSVVASQERCKSPDGGLRSMRLMLGDGADGLWCRFRVCAALGQLGRGFEQRAA